MIRDIRSSSRRKSRKAAKSRAWLNGVEVTDHCYYADDRRGVVRVLLRDSDGNAYLDEYGNVARRTLRGKVRIGRAA